jgi:hypothetical protein
MDGGGPKKAVYLAYRYAFRLRPHQNLQRFSRDTRSSGFILRGPNSDMDGINDGNAGGEFPEVRAADKVGDKGVHGKAGSTRVDGTE